MDIDENAIVVKIIFYYSAHSKCLKNKKFIPLKSFQLFISASCLIVHTTTISFGNKNII